jgi:hypothetical protein
MRSSVFCDAEEEACSELLLRLVGIRPLTADICRVTISPGAPVAGTMTDLWAVVPGSETSPTYAAGAAETIAVFATVLSVSSRGAKGGAVQSRMLISIGIA